MNSGRTKSKVGKIFVFLKIYELHQIEKKIKSYRSNVLDLEAKNNGPNKTQGQTGMPIHNIMSPHIFQLDPLLIKKT